MWRQRARDHVRRIGVGASVRRRPETPFGIGLEHKATQIGYGSVDLVGPGPPPRRHARIDRIEGVEAAQPAGAAEVDRDRQANPIRTEHGRDTSQLRQERRHQHADIGVHAVDGAPVDANGRQQPGVGAHTREIVHDGTVGEEDRAARVTALDGPVEVVPVVHPADLGGRTLRFRGASPRPDPPQAAAAARRRRTTRRAGCRP